MNRKASFVAGLLALTGAVAPALAQEESNTKKELTAKDVIEEWKPKPKLGTEYNAFGGSPELEAKVAAFSFRALGVSFEELWNGFAERCGMKERFAEKTMLVTTGAGANGSYVVSDLVAPDGSRGLTVFLLKTDQYTITATIYSPPGSKATIGSLSAVLK